MPTFEFRTAWLVCNTPAWLRTPRETASRTMYCAALVLPRCGWEATSLLVISLL